jgi:hypothetical protein
MTRKAHGLHSSICFLLVTDEPHRLLNAVASQYKSEKLEPPPNVVLIPAMLADLFDVHPLMVENPHGSSPSGRAAYQHVRIDYDTIEPQKPRIPMRIQHTNLHSTKILRNVLYKDSPSLACHKI